MANETNPSAQATETPSSIALAAQALRSETTVAKALPTDDDKKEDVAKAEDVTEEVKKAEEPGEDEKDVAKALSALPELIKAAVDAAVAPLQAELVETRKALAVVEANTQATLDFQGATTDVLKGLKVQGEVQAEVQKSLAAQVDAVANQPAGRRAVLNSTETQTVEKALPTAKTINLQPLRDWAKEHTPSTHERVAFVHRANAGDFTDVPQDVRKAMGVE